MVVQKETRGHAVLKGSVGKEEAPGGRRTVLTLRVEFGIEALGIARGNDAAIAARAVRKWLRKNESVVRENQV